MRKIRRKSGGISFLTAMICISCIVVGILCITKYANIAKQNTARATKRAEKNAEENAPIAEGIKTYLVGTMTATEIKNALVANGIEVSTPKVTAVAKLLVADGTVKVEKKVGDTKNYYTLA